MATGMGPKGSNVILSAACLKWARDNGHADLADQAVELRDEWRRVRGNRGWIASLPEDVRRARLARHEELARRYAATL